MIEPSVILVDDKKTVRETFAATFEAIEIGLHLICVSTTEEFQAKVEELKAANCYYQVKVLIFDLAMSNVEDGNKKFSIAKDIHDNFQANRIPIFIHSGHLAYYKDFDEYEYGTLFKIAKGKDTIPNISKKIKQLHECGFLDIFSSQGQLEQTVIGELHNAFTKQFRADEIMEIISSIEAAKPKDVNERVRNVFGRIAIRSLYQNIMDEKMEAENEMVEVSVNAVEHYYRRTNEVQFWTGDIFKGKEGDRMVFIITPRCNISNRNFKLLLMCDIKPIGPDEENAFKKVRNLRKGLTDDVTLSLISERRRFLTKTPQFEGGFIDFVAHETISEDEFRNKFKYHISVIDDLTNDVVRKFSSYMLRGGVSVTEEVEALYYIQTKYGVDEGL